MSQESGDSEKIAPEQDVQPCKHMEGMVSSLADGSLRGPARWYTQLHTMHCSQCRTALNHLRVVIDKVADLREDGPPGAERLQADRREGIERALDEVDGSVKSKG